MGWGGEGERESKIKRVGKNISLPLLGKGIVVGRGQERCTEGVAPRPHTHTPDMYKYKSQIITAWQREEGEVQGVGSEVGESKEGHRDKISHIYNFYTLQKYKFGPAGCLCEIYGTEGELSIQKKEGWSLRSLVQTQEGMRGQGWVEGQQSGKRGGAKEGPSLLT